MIAMYSSARRQNDQLLTDAQIIAAAREDIREFECLYERYADRLYRYALERTQSPAIAEDIVGETMVAALEAVNRFDASKGSVAGWLFTIARHRIADRYRRHARFWRFITQRHTRDSLDDGTTLLTAHLERADVNSAMECLSAIDQDIIRLRYGADLTTKEIGEVVGISDGAVRVRLSRALKRLEKELGPRYE